MSAIDHRNGVDLQVAETIDYSAQGIYAATKFIVPEQALLLQKDFSCVAQ
ncbi:MAG: hypothetical protein JJ956_15335 [Pseudomonadales bacterium]|nr:hypothetical protein [Pseudomonadales bacterium]